MVDNLNINPYNKTHMKKEIQLITYNIITNKLYVWPGLSKPQLKSQYIKSIIKKQKQIGFYFIGVL